MCIDYKSYLIFTVSMILILGGFLIRYRNATWLLFGVDIKNVRDLPSLKQWVGGRTMWIGFVLSGAGFFLNYPNSQTAWMMAVFAIILIYNTIVASRQFIK